VLWHCWLGGRKGIRPIKNTGGDGRGRHWLVWMEWRPARWSVCLPLLISPCNIKSRSFSTGTGSPGLSRKRAVKRLCMCVCVQLLNIGSGCPKYSEELRKIYSSDYVRELEQRNKVSYILFATRNTFCETWYLPRSWVHYDRDCHLVFMSQLLAYLQQTRLLFTLARAGQKIYDRWHLPSCSTTTIYCKARKFQWFGHK